MGRYEEIKANREIGNYLDEQAAAIKQISLKSHRNLSGESVHTLRVATRRAQAAFWVLEKSSQKPQFRKLRRRLSGLAKSLGKVRNLDVAIENAKVYGINCATLKAERKSARKKLATKTGQVRMMKIKRKFTAASASLKNAGPISMRSSRAGLRDCLSRSLRQKMQSPEELHRFRIMMKRTRYVLELMGRNIDPIRGIQDVLGNAHDLQLLLHFTGKNEVVSSEQSLLTATALRLAKPAVRFALKELGEN